MPSWDAFSVTGESARQLDAICDRFEQAWRSGQTPQLESFVHQAAEAERSLLLRLLLELELELAPTDRCPNPATYLARFPDQEIAIREAFEVIGRSSPAANPLKVLSGVPLLLGDYELLKPLGSGGMGKVFLARHRHMDRIVALKVMQNAGATADECARFRQEIRAIARVSHPNIVTAHDAGFCDGLPFLITEYVEGLTLAGTVTADGPLELRRALDVIRQAALALECAHRAGIVHRDVKPANLMIQRDGTVKLLDLGLARLRTERAHHDDAGQLTRSGMLMGTPDYMAPEQSLDVRSVDHRADIYSLGCTLFFALTGRAVYEAESVLRKLLAHQEEPVRSLRQICPEIPDEIDLLFQRMVAKRPDDRFQSMSEVCAEMARLSSARHEAAVESQNDGAILPGAQISSRLRRRSQLWFSGFAIIGLAVAAFAIPLGFEQESGSNAPETNEVAQPLVAPDRFSYVWSAISDVYHHPDCWAAKRISDRHRRTGMVPPADRRKHDCKPSTGDN